MNMALGSAIRWDRANNSPKYIEKGQKPHLERWGM